MAGSPLDTVGWTVIYFIDKGITEKPAQLMMTEYDRINDEATGKFNDGMNHSKQTLFIMIALLLIM